MSNRKFEFGDRVRHPRRPEWGIGSVVKADEVTLNGQRTQRLSVRFPNAGLKTLSAAHAELEPAEEPAAATATDPHPLAEWDKMHDNEWLAPLARKKVEEAMLRLPPNCRDPFNSLRNRLAASLDLYRFNRTGRSVIDWAIGQSGLEDPLTRFTRHELEQLFEPWLTQRDQHLQKLLGEAKTTPELIEELLATAPRAAREAVRRLTAKR